MKTQKSLFKVLTFLLAFGLLGTLSSCGDDNPIEEACNGGDETILCGSIGTRTLTADQIYTIRGYAYVASGDVLTINPGTILKAEKGDGADASALIIAKGAKIDAVGTAAKPIIFTSVDDAIAIGETASSLTPATSAGKWGGLIILGDAPISAKDEDGVAGTAGKETSIEGIPSSFGFSIYGGANSAHDAGDLSYVSIRFTGTKLGNDDEIQGLTLGGIGTGTSISKVEIISSDDDGIEIFGGTVNVSEILVAYQADDAIDLDQSYAGTVSNSMVLTFNPNEGNEALELDGPEGSSNTTGKYTIKNCTFINKGNNGRAAMLKSNSQGTIENCVFEDFNNWITVDGGSATQNYLDGDLKVINSQFDASSLSNLITADTTAIQTMFEGMSAGNEATTTFTKGSTADFSWTWSNTLNLLN